MPVHRRKNTTPPHLTQHRSRRLQPCLISRRSGSTYANWLVVPFA